MGQAKKAAQKSVENAQSICDEQNQSTKTGQEKYNEMTTALDAMKLEISNVKKLVGTHSDAYKTITQLSENLFEKRADLYEELSGATSIRGQSTNTKIGENQTEILVYPSGDTKSIYSSVGRTGNQLFDKKKVIDSIQMDISRNGLVIKKDSEIVTIYDAEEAYTILTEKMSITPQEALRFLAFSNQGAHTEYFTILLESGREKNPNWFATGTTTADTKTTLDITNPDQPTQTIKSSYPLTNTKTMKRVAQVEFDLTIYLKENENGKIKEVLTYNFTESPQQSLPSEAVLSN